MAQIHLQHLHGKKYRLSFLEAVILHAHAFTDFKHSIQDFYCPLPRDFTKRKLCFVFCNIAILEEKKKDKVEMKNGL